MLATCWLLAAAEDDKELVKHIGQSFRFSAVEVLYLCFSFTHYILMFTNSNLHMLLRFWKARKEKDMKAVHDEAMFGAPSSYPAPAESDDEAEEKIHTNKNTDSARITSLLSDQVI